MTVLMALVLAWGAWGLAEDLARDWNHLDTVLAALLAVRLLTLAFGAWVLAQW